MLVPYYMIVHNIPMAYNVKGFTCWATNAVCAASFWCFQFVSLNCFLSLFAFEFPICIHLLFSFLQVIRYFGVLWNSRFSQYYNQYLQHHFDSLFDCSVVCVTIFNLCSLTIFLFLSSSIDNSNRQFWYHTKPKQNDQTSQYPLCPRM